MSSRIPRVIKVNEVIGASFFLTFSNGEHRVVHFDTWLPSLDLPENSLMKALSDPDKRAGWILNEGTLRWPSLIATIELTSGAKWSAPLDIDPIVLYNASEPDESRPSAPPIGALLRTARKQAGLTQEELAYRSGTTKNHISRIENDRSDIELGTLAKIVEVGLGKKLDIRFLG